MHTPTSITAWWGVPECTRCVKDSRLQEESDVHSQASVTSITRTPWIVDTLSSFDAFGRQCDSGKHLWKNENRSHCRRMETFPIVFSVESEWNVAGGRVSFMEWSSIYQTGKNVLSMRSKASTRLHGIRFIYRRTFSKEESINDGLRRYIYNIRAPRYLLLPLFKYFLWYSISFTTRGPFNYSRCGITPTVIFVHANASRCISFSPSSFYPPPLSPGHISG